MSMLRCRSCGEFVLPKANACSRCGSSRLDLEPVVVHRRVEIIVLKCLSIAGAGAFSTVIGDSLLHGPGHRHLAGCVLLIAGIAMVTLAAMLIAIFATNADEQSS